MYKVLTLNNISATGLDRLPRESYEVASEISHPDAILLRSFNMHEMDLPETVRAIGRAGAGVNNIPIDKMTERGVVVFNAPGANANAVKELVVAGMLSASRNLFQGWEYARNLEGSDSEIHKQVEAGKKNFAGFELPGRTLGVVGLGAIGVRVANAAIALGMRVVGYDPTITVHSAWQMSSAVEQAMSIDDLLARSDYVTFHVPLVEATRHMINRERLKAMRDNVVILNFARNGIVDDEAVCEAINEGKVYAYVCDFPSNLLKNHPRVICLPHLGASTREAEDNCAIMVADQVRDYLEAGVIRNSVNFPEVDLPRAGVQRLTVVNRNEPDLVANISHVLGKGSVNIAHMINESRGDVAYTVVDVDQPLAESVIEEMKTIDGLLNFRVI
jgi:D-3-phosphoglycerate dehydrogenase